MNFYLKLKENISSVTPVMVLVLILGVTIAPLGGELLLRFLIGGVMVIVGLSVFLLGVDIGILPIGERSGAALTSRRSLPILLAAAFIIGFIVTVAEPDVQVLADQVRGINPAVSKWGLIFSIAFGVGFFVALGILRTIVSIPLRRILIFSYILVFILAVFAPQTFQGMAFDSGGATTGPMTVPFIMALGVGVAAVRTKSVKDHGVSENDSFGLTGMASIGPILAVIIFGIVLSRMNLETASVTGEESVLQTLNSSGSFVEITEEQAMKGGFSRFFINLPVVAKEVSLALMPLAVMSVIFQITLLKMPPMQVIRMIRGFIFSFAGLVIFLSGAQGGFMPVGQKLGQMLGTLAISGEKYLVLLNAAGEVERSLNIPAVVEIIILILTGCIFGAVTVCAEPAVWVLTDQVEQISGGAIRRKVLLVALSTGVAVSIGISMARVLFNFNLLYILIPGYVLALLLTFFCPPLFTGIAFDSGGVASGPMTSTFILSFALGVSTSSGGNPAVDGFGVIALVAMTPLIAIQLLGIVFKIKTAAVRRNETKQEAGDELL